MAQETLYELFFHKILLPIVSFALVMLYGCIKPIVKLCDKMTTPLRVQNSPELHKCKVRRVQEQVLEWIRTGRKGRLCTARSWKSGVQVKSSNYKKGMTGIDMAHLNDIIDVDTHKMIVRVEPLTSMGRLSSHLISMGYTALVIPEFEELTVGGLINGIGIETSSHKYGDFHYTCVEFEMVLADGRVVNCSKDEKADLFHAIPMSLGTLGFLTSASIRIIPAKKYVKLEYFPLDSVDKIVGKFSELTGRKEGNDFVEGIMFDLNQGVVMVGNMSDRAETGKVNRLGRWYKPWFHNHVRSFLTSSCQGQGQVEYEYIPLRDYIHRHNKGLFWSMEYLAPYADHFLFRYLFGWIFPVNFNKGKELMPVALVKAAFVNIMMVQDYVVPLTTLKEALLLAHKQIQVYPIWLCGTQIMDTPGMNDFAEKTGKMYVDIGLYGRAKSPSFDYETAFRAFEAFCLKTKGHNFTYSDSYLTRTEFQQMFNHDLYYKVRKELDCSNYFPEIYDKTTKPISWNK